MKKIDGMLNDNRKRLLLNLHLDQSFKVFPFNCLLAKLSDNHSPKYNRKKNLWPSAMLHACNPSAPPGSILSSKGGKKKVLFLRNN